MQPDELMDDARPIATALVYLLRQRVRYMLRSGLARVLAGLVRTPAATCIGTWWTRANGSPTPTIRRGSALAQLMPGPLAAQSAMYLGYVQWTVRWAQPWWGSAFVLPVRFHGRS